MPIRTIPSPDEIRATFANVREILSTKHLCLDATIDDYPIGRRDRGRCRLQVERAPGKGYRTVRTSKNNRGIWCKPHKSTYGGHVLVVIKDWDVDHQHVWLGCGNPAGDPYAVSVYVEYANGKGTTMAKCWRSDPPRREDHHYTTTTTRLVSLAEIATSGMPEGGDVSHHVLEADPPDEIAAWDIWAEELKSFRQLLLRVWSGS